MTSTEQTLEINVVDEILALIVGWLPYRVLYSCGHWNGFSSYALTVDGVKTEPIDRHGLCPDCCIKFIRKKMDWCNECESWVVHDVAVENSQSGSFCHLRKIDEETGKEEPVVGIVVSLFLKFSPSICYHLNDGALSLARIKRRGQ